MPQSVGQMYLTGAWLEAIFYGVNCMLFGFCIHVLTARPSSSRSIFFATILQFSLSTAHVIISLAQLLEAFAPGVDPDVYYTSRSTLFVTGCYIYGINVYVQELVLIWRLYGLWGQRFIVCVIPLIFWAGHVSVSLVAASSFIPTTVTGTPHNVLVFGLAGWALEGATNLTVNFGIAYRLWNAERKTTLLGAHRTFDYRGTSLWIVECGALITACTIILFSLLASGHEAGIVGVGIATQIATISPLLIVVRVGLAQTQPRPSGGTIGTYPLLFNVRDTDYTVGNFASQCPRNADENQVDETIKV